jgi:hypothetical protein
VRAKDMRGKAKGERARGAERKPRHKAEE